MLFMKKAARVKQLESKLKEEMEGLRKSLQDPNLSEDAKKRTQALLDKLEERMRAETKDVRKKCGMPEKQDGERG